MRFLTIVLLAAVAASGADYGRLVKSIEKEFTAKRKEYSQTSGKDIYRFEIADTRRLPFWCTQDISRDDCGEEVWVHGYGPVVRKAEEGAYVAVQSWIDRSKSQSRVTRVFLFREDGNDWKRVRTYTITENWEDAVGWVCQR